MVLSIKFQDNDPVHVSEPKADAFKHLDLFNLEPEEEKQQKMF